MKKKILCAILAAALMLTALSVSAFASDEEYTITEFDDVYEGYTPIPLLIVVINFDANGNGKDDIIEGKSSTDRSLDTYGEQWAYSPESHWAQICFGTSGKTLNNFYKQMSKDKFYWIPAEETYGTKNNGVIYATTTVQHPHARTGSSSSSYGEERLKALEAADKYIDYASYDKNGDGFISFDELSIVFIISGYNSKFGTGGQDSKKSWGMNCFEVGGSTWSTKLDGVTLLNGSRGGSFCYVGEYMTQTTPVNFGTIAHELGHVLGANDLYTYSGYTWCGGPGEAALQGGGSGNHFSGETTGTAPASIDPYYLLYYGFEKATVIGDGTYTLYSRTSKKGEYNILRVNTANPYEYYLIENKYKSNKNVSYDGDSPANTQGVFIWHIDEGIMTGYTLPNCYKGTPHAPGDTPLYPNGNTGGSNYDPWDKSDGTFSAKKYSFAGIEGDNRWTTKMTDDEIGDFDLKIEFLTAAGDEMQIKVTGTVALPPLVYASANESTTDSITVSGRVKDLNNGTLTSLRITMASDAAFTKDVKTISVKPSSDAKFACTFDGLTPKSTYYFKAESTGSNGTDAREFKGYTKAVPRVRTEDYIVYMYKGLTAANKPYEVTVKCGQELKYSFPMTKSTEKFGGWYLDSDCTEKYNMSFTKTTCEEMYLYARWIENENAVTLKIVGAAPKYELFAIRTGEHFEEPTLVVPEGDEVEGFYSDPEFTSAFNFDEPIDEAGEVTVYVRLKSAQTQTETSTQTQTQTQTRTQTEATSQVDVPGEKSGISPAVIVIAVVAFLAIDAVLAYFFVKKKKANQ